MMSPRPVILPNGLTTSIAAALRQVFENLQAQSVVESGTGKDREPLNTPEQLEAAAKAFDLAAKIIENVFTKIWPMVKPVVSIFFRLWGVRVPCPTLADPLSSLRLSVPWCARIRGWS